MAENPKCPTEIGWINQDYLTAVATLFPNEELEAEKAELTNPENQQ